MARTGGDSRIEDVLVAHGVLNSVVLLDNLAKYKAVSMMTLSSWYEEILYEVTLLKYLFIYLLVIFFFKLLTLLFLQANVVRAAAKHKIHIYNNRLGYHDTKIIELANEKALLNKDLDHLTTKV